MTEAAKKRTPPYPPRALFARFIKELADIGIPARIDTSVFPELSHGAKSSLLGALRYLNLIGSDGVPSASLVQLVAAPTSPQVLKPIVQAAYAFVFTDQFDLTRATAEKLEDRFQNQGLSGGTAQKAVAFFIALAINAGIPISGSLMQQRHPRTEARRRRRSRAPEVPAAAPVPPATPAEAKLVAEITAESILRLLNPKRMTPKEQNAVLTLVLYLKKKEAAETKETVVMV